MIDPTPKEVHPDDQPPHYLKIILDRIKWEIERNEERIVELDRKLTSYIENCTQLFYRDKEGNISPIGNTFANMKSNWEVTETSFPKCKCGKEATFHIIGKESSINRCEECQLKEENER